MPSFLPFASNLLGIRSLRRLVLRVKALALRLFLLHLSLLLGIVFLQLLHIHLPIELLASPLRNDEGRLLLPDVVPTTLHVLTLIVLLLPFAFELIV